MTERQFKNILRLSSAVLAALVLLAIPDIPLSRPLHRLISPLTLIPVDQVIEEPEPPRPRRRLTVGEMSAQAMPAPYFSPSQISAEPSQILLSEPSPEPPTVGLISELFDRPPEQEPLARIEPLASPLPDILTQHSDEGPARPPAALPGALPQRGDVYRGSGAADLETSTEPSYTGPNLNLPSSDLPSTGLTQGRSISGTPTPGVGPGDRYQSAAGTSPGSSNTSGLDLGSDLIGEGELSGLLAWLRSQKAQFPPVVRSYLETEAGDLCGITSHSGWNIFVQFSEAEHQLKLFLTRGGTGILLADSDFRRRSQLFGLGSVSRDAGGMISSVEAMRDKPSRQKTDEFYNVFGNWMESSDIQMGSRSAK